jgi:outer membrane protein
MFFRSPWVSVRRWRVLPWGLFLLFAGSGEAAADRITNVGLVDIRSVTTTYFRESVAVRELQAERDRINVDRARLEAEIFELEGRKVQAEREGLLQRALQLDEEVHARKQHLRDFVAVKNRQLAQQEVRLAESDAFLGELAAAIQFVAESEGLSLVLNKNNPSLLFFVQEIDVTDLVIAELGRRTSRN